ncbi:SGNH/GDSL hydrolase family protein [Klebsiella quasipneumoniae]|uniref:SGNH/GDSL hydrolase family protein n=1 Tax=Klebsiella quasipneumoniae TaxID=1463165 RepID=UPI002448A6EF|nr:GDSL family lipase [Klebsiella quasipneumoniae]MDH2674375.1 GDSL family lipase [Klebsiella quasipneumoniae]MDH2684440.1 GDSL family lipase [Klebsiella quasipneumoniae]
MTQRYNTGNSRPSNSMKDLSDNALAYDDFMNSENDTFIDRLENEKDTLAGAQKKMAAAAEASVQDARQNLIPLSRQYMTLAAAQADITNIPEGSTTYYRSPDDAALAIEVINTSGTLQPTGRTMISEQGVEKKIDTRLPPGDYTQDYFPAYHDKQGNVLMWFDNSCPDAAGLGPQLQEVVSSIPNLWAKNYLRQFDFDPAYFPLIFDKNGNVSLWMNDQRPDAAGLGPQLQEVVKNISGANSVSTFIEGDKYKFTFKQGRIFNGAPTSLNVAFTGDSWTEKNTIPQSLINLLGGNYKDPGFISCSTRTDGVMAGITLSVSNFTKYDGDNENNNAPPPYGSGPDGNAYYNVNAVGTLTWSNVKVTELSVFYYDGTGTFTITIDGVAPITINGGNTGVAKKYDISGLSATLHTVVIASSGVGVVSILGMYGKNNSISSGFTVSRMGNGGAIASDYLYWKNWIPQIVSSMDIDLLFIVLGTNDFRKSKGISEYKNGIQTIIDKYRIATPGICLCLVSPAQCNAAGVPALSEYDIAMRELALDNKTSFISGYQSFPDVYDNSGGAWVDALHLSNAGAYVLTRKIKDKFFQEL